MKQSIFTVKTNEALTRDIYKMTLEGDTSAITRPGQFVNVKIDGLTSDVPFRSAIWTTVC